jgi:S-DNA-T family DNA segregation ATPase FtsK/SpoIIIE
MPKPEPKAEIVIDMRRRKVLTAIAIVSWLLAILMYLAEFNQAGTFGNLIKTTLDGWFGFGRTLFPLFLAGIGYWIFSHRSEGFSVKIPSSLIIGMVSFLGMLGLDPVYNGGLLGKAIASPIANSIGPILAWGLLSGMIGVALWIFSPHIAEVVINLLMILVKLIGTVLVAGWNVIKTLAEGIVGKRTSDTEEEYDDEEYEEEYVEEDKALDVEPETPETKSGPRMSDDIRQLSTKKTAPEPAPVAITPRPSLIPSEYIHPSLKLLSVTSGKRSVGDIKENALIIKRTLEDFGLDVEMDEVSIGPSVTRYSLRPAQGLKLARIAALKNELSLALAAHPIRIEAPIPGQSLVGIEIPNRTVSTIGLGTLLSDKQFANSDKPLMVALGEGVSGKYHYADIAKTPHLLIAGATGSGKSVTVHNLILSLLFKNGPDRVRLIMVDPKRVELTLYNDIPHLLTPVIKDAKKAIMALRWAAKEMDRRYDLLESFKVRDIGSYHEKIVEPAYSAFAKKKNPSPDEESALPERMPYIVFIIDELADIMQAYPRELESGIVRLAQMSRAVGIHLIISTQRPSVNVITGLIKANIPSRLALKVSSQIDSRTILDGTGAETLLGKGDMLFKGGEMGKAERIQCAYVTEDEVKIVANTIVRANRGIAPDHVEIGGALHEDSAISHGSFEGGMDDPEDDMYEEAKQLVISTKIASTSYLQRKLRVGYARAARLMDLLEQQGVVGPSNGSKAREIMSSDSTNTYEESSHDTEDEE